MCKLANSFSVSRRLAEPCHYSHRDRKSGTAKPDKRTQRLQQSRNLLALQQLQHKQTSTLHCCICACDCVNGDTIRPLRRFTTLPVSSTFCSVAPTRNSEEHEHEDDSARSRSVAAVSACSSLSALSAPATAPRLCDPCDPCDPYVYNTAHLEPR
jgi:hypothetical protein